MDSVAWISALTMLYLCSFRGGWAGEPRNTGATRTHSGDRSSFRRAGSAGMIISTHGRHANYGTVGCRSRSQMLHSSCILHYFGIRDRSRLSNGLAKHVSGSSGGDDNVRFAKDMGNHPCPTFIDNHLGYSLLTSRRVIRLGFPLFDITGWLTCAFGAQLQALRSNPTSTSSSVHTSS
jgi:hypothetical protein